MTVSVNRVARQYLDVSADTPISVDIPAYEASDIFVVYGSASLVAVQGTDYTVSLADDFETFTITPLAALITKINDLITADSTEVNSITVRRELDLLTDATAAGVRQTEFTSREFDRTAMRDQQLFDAQERSVQLADKFAPPYPNITVTETPTSRTGKPTLVFTDEGIGVGPTSDQVASAQAAADQAVAAAANLVGGFFETRAAAAATDLSGFTSTIRTNGYAAANDGGAFTYARALSAINGHFVDAAGDTWNPVLTDALPVEIFGADADAADNSQAFKDAIDCVLNSSQSGQGVLELLPGRVYRCGDAADIVIDPAFMSLRGKGASLEFNKTCTDPSLASELLTGFASGWTVVGFAPSGSTMVYSGAAANAGTKGTASQAEALTQGRHYRVTIDIASITAAAGNQDVTVAVFDNAALTGDAFHERTYTATGSHVFDFKWTESSGTAYIAIVASNPATVNTLSLKELPRNYLVELAGDYSPNAVQFPPSRRLHRIEGLGIYGTGSAVNWGVGLFANTQTPSFRTEFNLLDVQTRALRYGLLTANRSYLGRWSGGGSRQCTGANVQIGDSNDPDGGRDAGENLRLEHLTLSNTANDVPALVVTGRNAGVTAYGLSFDYTNGHLVRVEQNARVDLSHCHFENNRLDGASKHYFDVRSGRVLIVGGEVLISANNGASVVANHFAKVERGGSLQIRDLQAFGCETLSGELFTGDGHWDVQLRGASQKNSSPFSSRRTLDNLVSQSSVQAVNGVDQDAWYYCLHEGSTRVDAKETANMVVEPLTANERTAGRKGLKIRRKVAGSGGTVLIAIPYPEYGMGSQECYVKVPANAGASAGTGDIFIDIVQTRLMGDLNGLFYYPAMTTDGATKRGDGIEWGGEFLALRNVNWVNGKDWTLVQRNGTQITNADAASTEFGFPARDSFIIVLNCNNLPVDSEVHICDLVAGLL